MQPDCVGLFGETARERCGQVLLQVISNAKGVSNNLDEVAIADEAMRVLVVVHLARAFRQVADVLQARIMKFRRPLFLDAAMPKPKGVKPRIV